MVISHLQGFLRNLGYAIKNELSTSILNVLNILLIEQCSLKPIKIIKTPGMSNPRYGGRYEAYR